MAEVVAEVSDEPAHERRAAARRRAPRTGGVEPVDQPARFGERVRAPGRGLEDGPRVRRQERPARLPAGSSALEQGEPRQVPERLGGVHRSDRVELGSSLEPDRGRGCRGYPIGVPGSAPRDGGQRGGHPAMIGERRDEALGHPVGPLPAAMRASGPGTPPGEPVIVRAAHVADLPESAARAGLADRRSRRPRGKRAGSARSDPPATGREPGLTPGRSATRRRPRPASRSGRRSSSPTRSTIRRSCGRGHSRGARGGRTTNGSIARRSGSRR